MLFTSEALEQASHEAVATYHASVVAGAQAVTADLTAGIGSDLIAFARAGPALGYEIDGKRAEYARWNLAANGLEAEVLNCDSMSAEWTFRRAFADPGRRVGGARTLSPADFQPEPTGLVQRLAALDVAAIKLSPMLSDSFLRSLGGCVEFVGFGRECREALVRFGSGGGWCALTVEEGVPLIPEPVPPPVEHPKEVLFDVHPAAVRAGCLGTLCRRFRLLPLGDSNGYLTGGPAPHSEWLEAFAVIEGGAFSLPAIRKRLIALGSATPVLKQRHAGLDLDELRKALVMRGPRCLSLAIYKVKRSMRYALLEGVAKDN